MTYNEWRDELKSNLLSVSEQERARVLDYYAEAYADRRDAGYSEREITAEFGAPYDAAQRILTESEYQYPTDIVDLSEESGNQNYEHSPHNQEYTKGGAYVAPNSAQNTHYARVKTSNNTWIFVLLCVLFAGPIFGVFMAMVGVTIGFSVAPFSLLIAGIATIGAGIVGLFSEVTAGVVAIGVGLILLGFSLIIMPLFIKLVKLMWKLFVRFFSWLKSLISGKEKE